MNKWEKAQMIWSTIPPLAVVSMNFACPSTWEHLHYNCVLVVGSEGAWEFWVRWFVID